MGCRSTPASSISSSKAESPARQSSRASQASAQRITFTRQHPRDLRPSPIKIEFIESREKVDAVLPELEKRIDSGLIEVLETTVFVPAKN